MLFFVVIFSYAQRKVLYDDGAVYDISSTYEEFRGGYVGAAVHSFHSIDKNFLSEGYESKLGYDFFIGSNLMGFDLEFALTLTRFNAVDKSVTGGFNSTRLTDLKLTLAYPLYADDLIQLNAFAGGGAGQFYNNGRTTSGYDRSVISRDGSSFATIGGRGYLHLFEIFFLRMDVGYSYYWTNIDTPARVESLYKDLHILYLNLGITIRFRGRPIGPSLFSS